MCLIVYSPTGILIERRVFDEARFVNPDGIGIMSSEGARKFLGPHASERGWRYLRHLGSLRIPHGIHLRWATHGAITRSNCHPFRARHSDALVMHNGMIARTAPFATFARSDTALFVEHYMSGAPGPEASNYQSYYQAIREILGIDNTLLVFHGLTDSFTVCNESSGEWIGEHWYSNTYSLPWDMGGPDWKLAGVPDTEFLEDVSFIDEYQQWIRDDAQFPDERSLDRRSALIADEPGDG